MRNTYLMKTNTNNYKKYGMIYSNQCTKCIKECTVFCNLDFNSDSCNNFKSLDDLKYTN